jgi:hypothetical protein
MTPQRVGMALTIVLGVGSCSWCTEPAPSAGDVQALAAKIDAAIAARCTAEKVPLAARASDTELLRRSYLNLAGTIPTPAEARAYLDDASSDKHQRLVKRLLAGPAYVEHFTTIWRKLLLPELSNSGEGQTAELENWLRKQIAANVGHDRMVREILTVPLTTLNRPTTAPDGQQPEPTPLAFYLAKDVKPENLAASTARLFLGVRLECAQCHDHPFARWKREQFWSYAAFFAGLQRQNQGDGINPIREVFDRREMQVPGGGQLVLATFLDGREPRWKFKVGARVTLAEWMTAPDNPFFARASVNRLWAHFFGIGLVDPVNDLEGPSAPSHPELLQELAAQFAGHGFDAKFLMRAITASEAYQRSSVREHPSQDDTRLFARMAVKGLSPEQVHAVLVQATGYQEPPPPMDPMATGAQSVGRSLRAEVLAQFNDPGERPTEVHTSIPQALLMMNGSFVRRMTDLKNGTLATVIEDKALDTAGRIESLFLAALSRRPTRAETDRLVKYVESGGPDRDPKKALADVFWALLNASEFILNH